MREGDRYRRQSSVLSLADSRSWVSSREEEGQWDGAASSAAAAAGGVVGSERARRPGSWETGNEWSWEVVGGYERERSWEAGGPGKARQLITLHLYPT